MPSRIVLVSDDLAVTGVAKQAADHAGATVTATLSGAGLSDRLEPIVHTDILLVEAGSMADDVLDGILPVLRDRAQRDRARLLVVLSAAQIDVVSGHLLGTNAELLCDPRMEERVAALLIAGAPGNVLHDASREAESARLRRLNDEVARIADTLARLSRGDTERGGVADRDIPFRAAPPPMLHGDTVDASVVRGAIRARRMRAQFFDATLFADPAWDMLLDLFAARIEGSGVSVSSLCIAAAVPPTTALRWITTMTDAGLFERQDDPLDRRRAFVVLTARGYDGMCRYAAALAKAGMPFA